MAVATCTAPFSQLSILGKPCFADLGCQSCANYVKLLAASYLLLSLRLTPYTPQESQAQYIPRFSLCFTTQTTYILEGCKIDLGTGTAQVIYELCFLSLKLNQTMQS